MKIPKVSLVAILTAVARAVDATPAEAVLDIAPRQDVGVATGAGCSSPVLLDASTNPWKNHTLHANVHYRKQVLAAAESVLDTVLKKRMANVANIGTFLWVETPGDIAKIEPAISDVPCNHILGIVIFGLQEHKCINRNPPSPTALASYQPLFIDPLVKTLKSHPNTAFALILEPETLSTLVMNADLTSCRQAAISYRSNMAYALRQLNLPNVVNYLDVGHGGTLGWVGNAQAGAAEIRRVYEAAGMPSQLRGYSTNVKGYNGWDLEPPEWNECQIGKNYRDNKGRSEKRFVQYLSTALAAAGRNATLAAANVTLPSRFVVDTGRSGSQGIRADWTEWCNVDGAGLGARPGPETGTEVLLDAFVWAWPPGWSDGTSDPAAQAYDGFCGRATAFKPSPERREWHQKYFEVLVRWARPGVGVDGVGVRDSEQLTQSQAGSVGMRMCG